MNITVTAYAPILAETGDGYTPATPTETPHPVPDCKPGETLTAHGYDAPATCETAMPAPSGIAATGGPFGPEALILPAAIIAAAVVGLIVARKTARHPR